MTRKATIARAVPAHPRASGGTSAPSKASKSHTTAISAGRPATQQGLGQAQALPAPQPAGGVAAAAPTPYSSSLPWDSAYEQSVGTANTKYGNTIAGLNYQKTATEQDFGLGSHYNDYQSNPYSRAALLESKFRNANRGTVNSYAAGGQLYAGSTSNALGANRSSYGQSHDSLEKEYRNALQEIQGKELGAGDERNEAIDNATWNRIERAAGEELDPSTAPGRGGPGGGSASTKIYKGKNGQRHGVGAGKPAGGKKKKGKR